jgi:hypothetical protein
MCLSTSGGCQSVQAGGMRARLPGVLDLAASAATCPCLTVGAYYTMALLVGGLKVELCPEPHRPLVTMVRSNHQGER